MSDGTQTHEPERLLIGFDRNHGLERLTLRLRCYQGRPYISLTKTVRAGDKSPFLTKGTVSVRVTELREAIRELQRAADLLDAGWPDGEEQQQDDQQQQPPNAGAPRVAQQSRQQQHTVDVLDADPGDKGC